MKFCAEEIDRHRGLRRKAQQAHINVIQFRESLSPRDGVTRDNIYNLFIFVFLLA